MIQQREHVTVMINRTSMLPQWSAWLLTYRT